MRRDVEDIGNHDERLAHKKHREEPRHRRLRNALALDAHADVDNILLLVILKQGWELLVGRREILQRQHRLIENTRVAIHFATGYALVAIVKRLANFQLAVAGHQHVAEPAAGFAGAALLHARARNPVALLHAVAGARFLHALLHGANHLLVLAVLLVGLGHGEGSKALRLVRRVLDVDLSVAKRR